MEVWEFENLRIWEFGSLGVWEFGNLGIWEFGNSGILVFGNILLIFLHCMGRWPHSFRAKEGITLRRKKKKREIATSILDILPGGLERRLHPFFHKAINRERGMTGSITTILP